MALSGSTDVRGTVIKERGAVRSQMCQHMAQEQHLTHVGRSRGVQSTEGMSYRSEVVCYVPEHGTDEQLWTQNETLDSKREKSEVSQTLDFFRKVQSF